MRVAIGQFPIIGERTEILKANAARLEMILHQPEIIGGGVLHHHKLLQGAVPDLPIAALIAAEKSRGATDRRPTFFAAKNSVT